MSLHRPLFRHTVALGTLILGSMVTFSPGVDVEDEQGSGGSPPAGTHAAIWQDWAADERAQAADHDWAADSAARGCTLIDIEFHTEVDPAYNAAIGAPEDLATIRVDRVEECGAPPRAATAAQARAGHGATSVPSGPRCNSATRGPGTICLASSGNWITASWKNRGSAAQTGFLRIYQIPTTATRCPTGSTWHTSATMTWSSGQTRSTSKSQTQNGAYTATIWRQNLVGHANWGSTCARF